MPIRLETAHIAIATIALAVTCASASPAQGTAGSVRLEAQSIAPGFSLDLSGRWLYKPGYLAKPGDSPRDPSAGEDGYVPVPVPQMLSRVRWWLDDSEGFRRFEDRRLAALGFDTERAEDGWYHLWLDLPKAALGDNHLFVHFDGVAMKCAVYINGHRLGEHTGMFSRFEFDLTPRLLDGRNLLAVYVTMERLDPNAIPLGTAVTANLTSSKVLSLSKGMFGPLSTGGSNRDYDLYGIWQPVMLKVRRGGKIDDACFAPTLDSAEVRVRASALGGPRNARLRARWTDHSTGEELASTEPVDVDLSEAARETVLKIENVKPKLWTPERPNLYDLRVTLEDAQGRVMDVWKHKVGFRTFEVRGNSLYLNGKRWWMRGGDQLPYGKNPWDPKLARKLVQFMHDGNLLITRTHCTPWNEAWLDAADEIGLGVSIEGVRPWALVGKIPPPPRDMVDHWKAENEDVIRRCRNHPSVLMWTVGNEMTLRDDANIDKWKILSELVQQTRTLDPTRPVVCSSGYYRKAELYDAKLKPNGIDDGDMDDLHSYRGWYGASPFVEDSSWIAGQCDYAGKRPIIGQEMATGYLDLDAGLPVAHYAKRLLVPQAWVGKDAEEGGDPSVFLEHHRAVTKRLAEQLRYQRGDLTSGFMLFSTECWFRNSYDPQRVAPYPVYEAVKQAFAPIGLALETNQRRFFAGDTVETAVFVTNDAEDIDGPCSVVAEFTPEGGKSWRAGSVDIQGIRYYQTIRVPMRISVPPFAASVPLSVPPATNRLSYTLRLRLVRGGQEVSHTEDPVEVFSRSWCEEPLKSLSEGAVGALGAVEGLVDLLKAAPAASVVSVGPRQPLAGARAIFVNAETAEREMPALKRFAESGGTVVVIGLGARAQKLFPDAISRSRDVTGEFVDISDTPDALKRGLAKTDLKWWYRTDGRAFVASATHNLKPEGPARPLARHTVVHGYIDEAKKADYITSPLVDIPAGKGRFVLCDLDLASSVDVDPAARRFACNLLAWAAE